MRNMVRSAVLVWLAGALAAGFAASAAAQTFQGGLRGSVRDPQGVIPGVTVVLLNEQTNVSRETATNAAGEYSFPAVDPGVYTVRASVPGYKTFERKGVRVATQQFITLDVTLEVGAIEESVTVTGEAPLIDTTTAATGDVLDKRTLESLPTVGRNVFLVSTTVPTVVSSGDTHWNRLQDQTGASLVSLGGGGVRANNYLLEGFPVTDITNRSSTNPTIESVEEMKVQVHTYDAEMGRTGGGVFNVTAKSGTNDFHGSAFGQWRPLALVDQNFFLQLRDVPKADQFWRDAGGGFGGPIFKNKTFFWFAVEGYRDGLTQNSNLLFPTLAERNGDFSGLTDSQGRPIVLYNPFDVDPVTGQRRPFANNQIPASMINPVGAKLLSYLPTPDVDRDNGQANYFGSDVVKDAAQQGTIKLDHHFGANVSLSGFFLRQTSHEPNTNFFRDNKFAAPSYQLDRGIDVLTINNTYIVNQSTVVTLRYGWNRFDDNYRLPFDFDAHTLGFDKSFADAIPVQKFPDLTISGYGGTGFTGKQNNKYYSSGFNGTLTKLAGAHSLKFGADYRRMGVDSWQFGTSAGTFTFNGTFTQGPNPVSPSARTGNPIADILLGYPVSGSIPVTTPIYAFTNYYSGYAQDDWRVNDRFTVNYGLRLEHESGLMEKNDNFTVGFDQTTVSPLNALVTLPIDPLTGQRPAIKGGLIFAGQNGAPTYQGNPPAVKLSPRVGTVFSLNADTVLRGGYGVFYAPWNYPSPGTSNYAQWGYSATTTLSQNTLQPITSIDNPFPGGLVQPSGNSLGLLTGTGGDISFIDPGKTAPRVQQYSVDLQRELPGNMSLSLGYVGSRGDHLGYGGTNDVGVNINQLDPKYFALGSQLVQAVPNPFYGIAQAGTFANQKTIQLGQLLRPFPQFQNILMKQSTGGRSVYNAAVFQLKKRVVGLWGGNFSYTYSRLNDNQFGQPNYYGLNSSSQLNPQNSYDLDAEYGISALDSPHKIVIAPIINLPFGKDRKFLNNSTALDYIVGGWQVALVGTIQSGFPITITQLNNNSGLFGSFQRPNVASGVDPVGTNDITGQLEDSGGRNGQYLNPAAWTLAPAFTFGNAPRTDARVRTPMRNQLDMSVSKDFSTGGSTRLQVRLEMINVTNTPWYVGFNTQFGSGSFGQVTTQANYSRLTQLTFRFLF